jgi:hypothetical protein
VDLTDLAEDRNNFQALVKAVEKLFGWGRTALLDNPLSSSVKKRPFSRVCVWHNYVIVSKISGKMVKMLFFNLGELMALHFSILLNQVQSPWKWTKHVLPKRLNKDVTRILYTIFWTTWLFELPKKDKTFMFLLFCLSHFRSRKNDVYWTLNVCLKCYKLTSDAL